mmetsp:Transcript_48652/g.155428  ORF Transcript_48652/g.155428 Transcript_48652/m.155428 type:complete len:388 (+) Transcript_48652:245-1408(+)
MRWSSARRRPLLASFIGTTATTWRRTSRNGGKKPSSGRRHTMSSAQARHSGSPSAVWPSPTAEGRCWTCCSGLQKQRTRMWSVSASSSGGFPRISRWTRLAPVQWSACRSRERFKRWPGSCCRGRPQIIPRGSCCGSTLAAPRTSSTRMRTSPSRWAGPGLRMLPTHMLGSFLGCARRSSVSCCVLSPSAAPWKPSTMSTACSLGYWRWTCQRCSGCWPPCPTAFRHSSPLTSWTCSTLRAACHLPAGRRARRACRLASGSFWPTRRSSAAARGQSSATASTTSVQAALRRLRGSWSWLRSATVPQPQRTARWRRPWPCWRSLAWPRSWGCSSAVGARRPSAPRGTSRAACAGPAVRSSAAPHRAVSTSRSSSTASRRTACRPSWLH